MYHGDLHKETEHINVLRLKDHVMEREIEIEKTVVLIVNCPLTNHFISL